MRLLFAIFIILVTNATVVADTATDIPDAELDAVRREINQPLPSAISRPLNMEPLLSVNTDTVLDMNWQGALEFTDPAHRAGQITSPLLQRNHINNLEIKLRVLDVHF